MKRMWSRNELKEIVKGTDLTAVDLKAKTLEQINANFKGDNINFVAPTGLTITNTYNRLEVINQVLYCIVNFKIENNSGETKSFSGVDLMTTLPNEYASKVIDVLGKSVADVSDEDYAFITGEPALALKNANTYAGAKLNGKIYICNRNTENKLSLFFNLDSSESLADGDFLHCTCRIALTLL